MKTLTQYLAEYLDAEFDRVKNMVEIDDLHEWIKEGIDAYMSTENVEVLVQPVISCETCHKNGETICGRDFSDFGCWEIIK